MLGLFLPQELGTLFTGLDESQTTSTNPPKQRGVEESNCPKSFAAAFGDKELSFRVLMSRLATFKSLDGFAFTIRHRELWSVCISKTTPRACQTDLGSCSFSLSKAKPKSFIILLNAQKDESMVSFGSMIQKSSKKWSVTMKRSFRMILARCSAILQKLGTACPAPTGCPHISWYRTPLSGWKTAVIATHT